jgi:cardiolipin synthase
MVSWPVKREHEKDLSDERLDPCWIPVGSPESTNLLPERISDSFYRTGKDEVLLKDIIDCIGSAEQVVCACSFILSEERIVKALEDAANNKVNVYLLTASEKHLENESRARTDRTKQDIALHKQILDRLAGKVLVRTASCFHSKFVLTDPNDRGKCQGFLVSANLAKETFAEKLELGLKLENTEVVDVFKQFLIGFWTMSEHEVLEQGRMRGVSKKQDRFLHQGGSKTVPDIPCTMGKHLALKERIIELIENSEETMYLSSFGFRKDHEVLELVKKEAENREIIAFARPRTVSMGDLIDLASCGIKVYGHPELHAKGILGFNDGQPVAIMMTANFEQRGLDEGFETGIELRGKRARTLLAIFENWQKTFPEKLETELTRGQVTGKIITWDGGEFVEKEVVEDEIIDMGQIRVKSMELLETHEPGFFAEKEGLKLFQKRVHRWENVPPVLPDKAEFVEKVKGIELYKKGKKQYLAIKRSKDYKKAVNITEDLEAEIVIL